MIPEQTRDETAIDHHLARFLGRLAETDDPDLLAVFSRLSRALRQQHVCLDVDSLADADAIIDKLAKLPVTGIPGEHKPLILDGSRLYLQRYFDFEAGIAEHLLARNRPIPFDASDLAKVTGDDKQSQAARRALTRQLTVITGGPGTGKTTTVASILRVLLETGLEASMIRLAAPTGKAAARLDDAINQAGLTERFEVQTLHRLLGMRADGRSWRHSIDNPLPLKLLVIDETSMVDLAMMHRILEALPLDARLILLGDADQLPSVDVGNILGDICKYPDGLLADAICHLDTSYRFSPDKGIGRLSQAIRDGVTLSPNDDDEVQYYPLTGMETSQLVSIYDRYLECLQNKTGNTELLDAFDAARILSPLREGPHGAVQINEDIEALLEERGLIDLSKPFYHGRPILVTRNDYNLRLFNGDIGLCVRAEDGSARVIFRDVGGTTREYLATRLPTNETCFAMTVHKAQGSEFDRVALVLPAATSAQGEQIMTRELVYTAVTRARSEVRLYFDGDTLQNCVTKRTVRHSGLGERFMGGDGKGPKGPGGKVGQMEMFG